MKYYFYLNRILVIGLILSCSFQAQAAERAIRFHNHGVEYQVIPDAVLVPKEEPGLRNYADLARQERPTQDETQLKTFAQSGIPEDDGIIGTIGGMLLVKKSSSFAPLSAQASSKVTDEQSVWYVQALEHDRIGIVNGELFVHLLDASLAPQVASDYGFTLVFIIPNKPVALMQAKVGSAMLNAIEQARDDSRVKLINLRIIENPPQLL